MTNCSPQPLVAYMMGSWLTKQYWVTSCVMAFLPICAVDRMAIRFPVPGQTTHVSVAFGMRVALPGIRQQGFIKVLIPLHYPANTA